MATTGRLTSGTATVTPSTGSGRLTVGGSIPNETATPTGRLPQPALDVSPWGFVQNFVGGAVDMVKGLGQLFIAAPAHDIAQGIQNLWPGEQSLEQEPSQLATIARTALPGAWFPGPDLGGKWGSIASDYAHRYGGATNIARGLYEDPLSYVMDALVVADGVGLIGKAGRVGVLQKMPKVVSNGMAERILGPSIHPYLYEGKTQALRYGSEGYANLSRSAQAFDQLKLSKNFMIRGVQKQVYGRLSVTPEQAIALGYGERTRGVEVINAAEAFAKVGYAKKPLNILKPKVGEYLAKHEVSKLNSAFRVNTQTVSAQAVERIAQVVNPRYADEITGELRHMDADLAGAVDQGVGELIQGPELASFKIDYTPDGFVQLPSNQSPILRTDYDVNAALNIARKYGQAPGRRAAKRGERQLEDVRAPDTVYGKGGSLQGGTNSFQVKVDAWEDAGRAAKQVLDENGYGNNLRYIDDLGDEAAPGNGLHFFGQDDAGREMHLVVGTHAHLEAMRAAQPYVKYLKDVIAEMNMLAQKFAKVKGRPNTVATLAERMLGLKNEAKATREFLQHELFADTRATYWEKKGVAAYSPEAKGVLRLRPVKTEDIITPRLMQEGFNSQKYPMQRMMSDKYTPHRIEKLRKMEAEFLPEFEKIITNAERTARAAKQMGNPRLTADSLAFANLVKYLNKHHKIPQELAYRLIDKTRLAGRGTAAEKAARLIDRVDEVMWDYTVTEGAFGLQHGFAPWDWKTIQQEFLDAHRIVPSWMPNLPIRKQSDLLAAAGTGTPGMSGAGKPALLTKDWNRMLFGEGSANLSIGEATARASRILVTHREAKRHFANMDANFGRNATIDELKMAEQGHPAYADELFYNPEQVGTQVDLRGELLVKTLTDVPRSGDVLESTIKALDLWNEKALKEGINNLNGPLRAVPKAVARQMQKEYEVFFGKNMKIFWDTPLKVWKASVLSLSPRWVINNTFGNAIFMGVENPAAVRKVVAMHDSSSRVMVRAILGDVDDPISGSQGDLISVNERGFYQEIEGIRTENVVGLGPKTQALSDVLMGNKNTQTTNKWAGRAAKVNAPSRGLQWWSGKVRNMNSVIEETTRNGILIDELARSNLNGFAHQVQGLEAVLKKIANEGYTQKDLGNALTRVDRVLGNFMRYSPVEQGVIRRFFMPFYGFYRHMMNVILRLPFEHPLKGSVFQQVNQVREILEQDMPEYLKGQAAVHIGDLFGTDTYVRLKGMNPLQQITEDYGPVNLLDPRLKLFIERNLGINTYTGDPFDPEDLGLDNIIQTHDGQYWEVLKDGAGNVLDVVRTGRPLPSMTQHIGSQFGLTNFLPGFDMYKRSIEQNVASWAGAPLSQPSEDTVAYDREVEAEALTIAQGGGGFGEFGEFGSFGSFA